MPQRNEKGRAFRRIPLWLRLRKNPARSYGHRVRIALLFATGIVVQGEAGGMSAEPGRAVKTDRRLAATRQEA